MNAKRYSDDAHWSGEDLLGRLYGLDAPEGLSDAHLESCALCRKQLADLTARRTEILSALPEVADDRLRAQRQSVLDSVTPRRFGWLGSLVPAGATALVLVLGIALQRPAPTPPTEMKATAVITQSDQELMTQIATLMENETPRAADPIRGLFDSQYSSEEH